MAAAGSASSCASRQAPVVFFRPKQHLITSAAAPPAQSPASLGLCGDPGFISPDLLWSQLGTADNATITTTTAATTAADVEAIFAQDPMSFGQHWTADSGEGFPAAPSLDIDFSSFDPALIDSLPASIPDFFLVPPPLRQDNATSITTTAADAQQQQFQQQFESHMLHAPQPEHHLAAPPSFIPGSVGSTQSLASPASSLSDKGSSPRAAPTAESSNSNSNSRSGAGRLPSRRNEEQQQQQQEDADEDADVVLKRKRNTIAARKYRQKRLDRIKELEDALEGMTRERDDLRLRLARQEAETAALREMMQMKSGQGQGSGSTP